MWRTSAHWPRGWHLLALINEEMLSGSQVTYWATHKLSPAGVHFILLQTLTDAADVGWVLGHVLLVGVVDSAGGILLLGLAGVSSVTVLFLSSSVFSLGLISSSEGDTNSVLGVTGGADICSVLLLDQFGGAGINSVLVGLTGLHWLLLYLYHDRCGGVETCSISSWAVRGGQARILLVIRGIDA